LGNSRHQWFSKAFFLLFMRLFLLSWLAGSLVVSVANAQKADLPEPRLYVGGQASYMRYPGLNFGFFAGFPSFEAIYPLAAASGYRVSRNVTLEVGFTGRFPATQYFSDSTSATEYSRYAYAVPILVRSAFVRATSTNPWRVEAEGGLVILHGSQQLLSYRRQGGTQSLGGSLSSDISDAQLALGVGATYRLNQHWRLTGDLQGQYSLISSLVGNLFRTDALGGFGGGAAVGIRYAL